MLYAVARDNEGENLIQRVSEDKNLLIKLARKAVNSDEKDAKWQIAQYLGDVAELEAAEPILLLLVEDADEYVRRRSLQALSVIGSKETERHAILAWETDQLYPRIGAIHALSKINSDKLDLFLELAKNGGRKYLVENALKLQAARQQQR